MTRPLDAAGLKRLLQDALSRAATECPGNALCLCNLLRGPYDQYSNDYLWNGAGGIVPWVDGDRVCIRYFGGTRVDEPDYVLIWDGQAWQIDAIFAEESVNDVAQYLVTLLRFDEPSPYLYPGRDSRR